MKDSTLVSETSDIEKDNHEVVTSSSLSVSNHSTRDSSEVDVALLFLKENGLDSETNSRKNDESELEKVEDPNAIFFGAHKLDPKVLRKVDMFILPFLCCIYLLMFLDKALLNYAASMGIKKHLKGDEFSNLGTIFSAAYIFMEPIVTYLIQKYPISKVLSVFITTWGIVLTCHCACKSYASLMIVRTLLGLFEASFQCGRMYSHQWYVLY